jgi:hypothetical protein
MVAAPTRAAAAAAAAVAAAAANTTKIPLALGPGVSSPAAGVLLALLQLAVGDEESATVNLAAPTTCSQGITERMHLDVQLLPAAAALPPPLPTTTTIRTAKTITSAAGGHWARAALEALGLFQLDEIGT